MTNREERLRQRSDALVENARRIRVLSTIAWPEDTAANFLESWRTKQPTLPPKKVPRKFSKQRLKALKTIVEEVDRGDPVDRFLARTAHSYYRAGELVRSMGTPEFFSISKELYGHASGVVAGAELSHLDLATRLLDTTDEFMGACRLSAPDTLDAKEVARRLRREWKGFFETPIRIVVDSNLSAKASASSKRVRLRANASFTEQDVAQLSVHEIGVHALTSRNGHAQPLAALGLGAPRTTATQEGLATFAELVTGSIDLSRLRRISLRVRALHLAESGANFLEVFEALLEDGEGEEEAVRTTMRIFRGGDPEGRHVFTKDVVYLKGLFAVHTFMRKAMVEERLDLLSHLFMGRVTLDDVVDLGDMFTDGTLDEPKYMPRWATNLATLGAFLSISALSDHVDLQNIELHEIGDAIT